MATLQTIRNRGGLLVSIVIGLALLAFIVGDALSSGSQIFNKKKNEVGEIAGEGISIMDYQKLVTKNEELVKMMNNSAALNEEQQSMLRENTWQQLVLEKLMDAELEEAGITVKGEELYDLMLGEHMNPTIRQMFADPETGEVDKDRARLIIQQLLAAPDNTPQKQYWLSIEKETARGRLINKYSNLLSKALYVTDAETEEAVANEGMKQDISYIVKNYTTISDSSVKVSDSEISEYYSQHEKLFQQEEARKIVYVNFDIEASGEDFKDTEEAVARLSEEFAASGEPLEFVNLASEKKADRSFYKQEEIKNDSLARFLFSGEEGVFGPYLEDNAYKISRTADMMMLPDSVKARHILIAPKNNDYMGAKAVADSLAKAIAGGADFEELARNNSIDQNSAVNGGDLGWFKQNDMIQPFSDSAFMSRKNEVKVVLTQYGAHVLQVTDLGKAVKKIRVATVEKEVIPSTKTTNKIYNDARTFAEGIVDAASFDKRIGEVSVTKRLATVRKNERTIAGMERARDMIRQIYMTEEPGVVKSNEGSIIFENGNKYTVAVLTDIMEEGTAPLANVASEIKRLLIRKKKAALIAKDMEAAAKGSESLLSIAQKTGTEVMEANDITFNSFQIPGAGIEPAVIGAAATLAEGTVSAPIEGNQGVFILMVNKRADAQNDKAAQDEVRKSLVQRNMYRAAYQAVQAVIKNGNVIDTRYRFY